MPKAGSKRVKKNEVDIDNLWEKYSNTRKNEDRNQLIEFYFPLVKYTATHIYAKLPDKVEIDDLISAGIFGLMDAINAYDPKRGVKFATYCTPRIRGSILDEIRNMDWVPRLVRSRAHQLNNAKTSLESSLGRLPTEEETAGYLGMDSEDFNRLKRDANALQLFPLDNSGDYNVRNKEILVLENTLSDPKSSDPVIEAQKKDLKYMLTKGLSRAERLILILYYYEEMTMDEIGATLDLGESRVSQIHSSIIKRTKAKLTNNSQRHQSELEFMISASG